MPRPLTSGVLIFRTLNVRLVPFIFCKNFYYHLTLFQVTSICGLRNRYKLHVHHVSKDDSVLSSISRRNVNQYSRIFLAKNEKQYIYMPALSVSPQQKRLICSKWRQSADTDDTVCADGERCSRCITTSENRRLEKLARRLADLYVEWAFCRETGANSVAEDLRLR